MAYIETDAAETIQKKEGNKAAIDFLDKSEANFPYAAFNGKVESENSVKDVLLEEKGWDLHSKWQNF